MTIYDEGRRTKDEAITRPSSFVIITLVFILGTHLAIGALYAVKTPAWQVPDEPAHYNTVRFIAENRALPVLQPGDYDAAYLERVKSEKFPPSLPIDSIRYEAWQPPLYYLLAAPVYAASGGSLLALRLFSVLIGGGVIVLAFLIARQVAPGAPALALGTAAFVAFVPQHVAVLAGAQNDGLAELLLAAIMFQIINLKSQISNLKWGGIGVLVGLALITKGTIYITVVLAGLALWLTYRTRGKPLLSSAAWVAIPALVIALPWWARNVAVYGWPDVLGSLRHDAVVLGQPTPAEWIARYGLGGYLSQFALTTFRSFWGQFGWMGVPMNDKYYLALALVSLVAFVGLLLHWKNCQLKIDNLKLNMWYLIFWVLSTAIVYLGYNVKYVQFQGRYLFPALIPIGLAFTLGLWQWVKRLPIRWREAALALPLAALAALDVVALFRMIIPALAR